LNENEALTHEVPKEFGSTAELGSAWEGLRSSLSVIEEIISGGPFGDTTLAKAASAAAQGYVGLTIMPWTYEPERLVVQ
jgi:hypothetical protein